MRVNCDKIIHCIYEMVKSYFDRHQSRIITGKVTEINPLKILIEGDNEPCDEELFHLSPFVKVMVVNARLREVRGEIMDGEDKITIDLTAQTIKRNIKAKKMAETNDAETISKTMQAESLSKSLDAESTNFSASATDGSWSLSNPVAPAIDNLGAIGPGYSRTESMSGGASISFSADDMENSEDISEAEQTHDETEKEYTVEYDEYRMDEVIENAGDYKIHVYEEPFEDETHGDHKRHKDLETDIHWTNRDELDTHMYDQTTLLELVLWRGMKVGDIVLMASFNNNERYYVFEVLNRGPL